MTGERRSAAERKKERLRALLYLAEQDTDAAKLLSSRGNHYAAYHCQQAAEKLIRALLLQHDIEPGLDHHLDVLIGKLPDGERCWAAISCLGVFCAGGCGRAWRRGRSTARTTRS